MEAVSHSPCPRHVTRRKFLRLFRYIASIIQRSGYGSGIIQSPAFHTALLFAFRGAVGLVELITVMVVTGILLGVGFFIFNRVTDQASSSVAQQNLSTVVSVLQEVGVQRNQDGTFNYAGSSNRATGASGSTGNANNIPAANDTGAVFYSNLANTPSATLPTAPTVTDAAGSGPPGEELIANNICALVSTISEKTTGLTVKPYYDVSSGEAACNANAPTASSSAVDPINSIVNIPEDPSGVYVTINSARYQNVPPGHIVRVIVKPNPDTTLCAILVRSGTEAGIGYDSWNKKTVDGDATDIAKKYEAHCLPLGVNSGNASGTPLVCTLNGLVPKMQSSLVQQLLMAQMVVAVMLLLYRSATSSLLCPARSVRR